MNNQPQRMMDDRNGMGPQGGYIGRITNDAREDEMEENVGQVRDFSYQFGFGARSLLFSFL